LANRYIHSYRDSGAYRDTNRNGDATANCYT
jgi:hypothetical protein